MGNASKKHGKRPKRWKCGTMETIIMEQEKGRPTQGQPHLPPLQDQQDETECDNVRETTLLIERSFPPPATAVLSEFSQPQSLNK